MPDSIAVRDTVADALLAQWRADSAAQAFPLQGVVIESEGRPAPAPSVVDDNGASWILTGLLLLFVIVALRFRNNYRYVVALVRGLTEVRVRQNAFDDTVRETSLLIVLNILESLSAGVVLAYGLLGRPTPIETAVCMGVCMVYSLVMWIAYSVVGNVFSDGVHTRMWVKGYAASQGLLSLLLLPVALMCVCYPGESPTLVWVGAGCFISAKIAFLCKGFRIFFTQISSWVLFLYYLCSLEIVPLILTGAGALAACGVVERFQ